MSNTLWKVLENHVFWHGDLDLWPMTLIFKVDPDATKVHPNTKFRVHKSYTSWDMNFCLVNFYKVTDRRKVMHKSPLCISTGGLNKHTVMLLHPHKLLWCQCEPGTVQVPKMAIIFVKQVGLSAVWALDWMTVYTRTVCSQGQIRY